ncbi:uncharacterized protein [Anabrus simplex]
MDSYEKIIIGLPDFLPCSPNAFCEWKILMERQVKGLLFEFKMEDNNNGSNIPSTTYFKNRHIEVKWLTAESERWILWTVNENALKYPSKLAIKSKTAILKYFSPGCYFVPQHNIQAIISTENMQQGYDHGGTGSLFYVFLSSGIMMVGITILMTCLCCHRRNKKRSRVQSSLVGNRTRTVPDKHEGGGHLVAAFRDFVSTSRRIAYVNGDFETEDLIFDLDTAESLPGTGNKFIQIQDDETDDEEGNRKRCPSFEVKSGLPFSHSPAASKVDLKNINEVSSVYTANQNIVEENIVKTEDTHRQRSFLKTIRHIFHSFVMKSQCSCPYECSFLRPSPDQCKDLEESSLESLLDKFNRVVLSLHWSDNTSCSFRSDTDYSIQAGADEKLIELVHKGTNSDFFSGQKFAEETLEKKNGSSSPELWGTPLSEAETFHSHQSSGSERSYFSIFQSGHTQTSDPAAILCQHSESRRHRTL